MLKKIINIILVIVLIIPSVIIPDMRVRAKTLGDVEQELKKYKADYEANKNKINATESEIEAAKKNIQTIYEEIIQANNQMIALNEEIDKLNIEIEEKNKEIKKKEDEIKAIMNFVQKSSGDSAYLEYAFGAASFTDFIYRVAVSEQLANYNKDLIKQFEKMVKECEEKIKQNNQKTKELENTKNELSKKQKSIESLIVTLNNSLSTYEEERIDIEEEIRMKEDAIEMYKDMGCESDDDLDVCTAQKLPVDTQLFRPLKVGWVSQEFGKPDSVTSHFYSIHGGIDITTTDNNTPVYAAGAGLVVAISRNQRCGNNIVYIQHRIRNNGREETYTTSYWHLRKVFVKEGQTVTKENIIGIMGGAASDHDACALGAHVHFVVATGLYLQDYYYLSTFNARRINPRTLVNFPAKRVTFKDRFIKY